MEGQEIGGWVLFAVGLLGIVASVVIAAVKAALDALRKATGDGRSLAATDIKPPSFADVFNPLIKTPAGLLFVLGLLAMYLGLVLVGGGHFLGLEIADPTPA